MESSNMLVMKVVVVGLFVAMPVFAGSSWKERTQSYTSSSTTLTSSSGVYTSGASTLDHPGRLLASNCFQCHGTNGHGMAGLAGKSSSDIYGDMYEMQLKPSGSHIMVVNAKGYTTTQLKLIADYFSRQQR